MILSWGVIGVTVGLLLGITGAGGAVIAVPLFVYLADANIRDATGLSLIAVLAGAILNWIFQARATDYGLALLLFFFSAIGSYAFKPLKALSPDWVITSIFLASTGWSLYALWRKEAIALDHSVPIPGKSDHHILKVIAGGIGLGGLITMTGLGGGVILIPFLRGVFRIPLTRAAATSLLTVLLSSIFALWVQREWLADHLETGPTGALVAGSVAAALATKMITPALPAEKLDRIRTLLITFVILISAGSLIYGLFARHL